MAFSSRGWVPFGVLVVVSVTATAFVLVALDGATQAEYAAVSANTTTSAEPALPLPVVAVAAVLSAVIALFSSALQRVEGEEDDDG
jgi:hypothetical protein